jgi:ferritin-like protein
MPFKKGQSGNPAGRKKKEYEIEYSNVIQSACSISDWKEICKVAIGQAKRGDERARKWLSDNLVGLPVQKTELTGKDGNAVKIKVCLDDTDV